MAIKLNIAKEFSPMPIGRYRTDSPEESGETFREDILIPRLRRAVQEKDIVEVNFEGMEGLNASFLDEAFGGLVRSGEWTADQVLQIIRFVPEHTYFDPYIKNARDYIREAGEHSREPDNER